MTDILQLSGKDLQKELDRIVGESRHKRREWTEKEIEIVRALREKDVPYKDIGKALGRTVNSISYLVSHSPYYE